MNASEFPGNIEDLTILTILTLSQRVYKLSFPVHSPDSTSSTSSVESTTATYKIVDNFQSKRDAQLTVKVGDKVHMIEKYDSGKTNMTMVRLT